MYRKVFKIENKEDLTIKLPDEYLHKELEVIAFTLEDTEAQYHAKKKTQRKRLIFSEPLM